MRDRDWQRDNWQSEIRFGEPTQDGLTISRVEQGSHYYRSGLRDGDVIISYNGQPLRNQDEFGRWANDRSSERVPVIVLRDGRRETVYIQYENDRNQAGGYATNTGSYASQAFLGVRFEMRHAGRGLGGRAGQSGRRGGTAAGRRADLDQRSADQLVARSDANRGLDAAGRQDRHRVLASDA